MSIKSASEATRVFSELELMKLHVEALFNHNSSGRMTRVNEARDQPAPRFFVGHTARGSVCRFRYDLSDEQIRELEAACASETSTNVSSDSYEAILERTAPVERVESGPAYCFPKDLNTTSKTYLVNVGNLDVLRPHFTDWLDDVTVCQPFVAYIQDGRAVSVCASVRISPVADEAGVETNHHFRGQGFAALVVSAWAKAVRELGRIPLYSTSWQNLASQALARKLGLRHFGSDLHIS